MFAVTSSSDEMKGCCGKQREASKALMDENDELQKGLVVAQNKVNVRKLISVHSIAK